MTLRPGWPEDAPALHAAIAHEDVVMKLAKVPWPYTLADAAWFLGLERDAATAQFVICDHEAGAPRVIGTIGIHREGEACVFGYWLTPSAWGRGYATEAGRAVLDIARHALPIRRLNASYFVDNPASGRVLRKLGFRETGRTVSMRTLARREPVEAVLVECDLDDQDRPAASIAA
ncbi:N-acetyltransferase [Sphingomonas oligophenolica]|uniref:N-acetyltransferase n=1 Tax=Sphingomonas oligophenolica TaxID=301154 RepID=A0A502CLQ5_9SPHN|nr:N-acetyltransferase [Sphingomonas oligophenolica]